MKGAELKADLEGRVIKGARMKEDSDVISIQMVVCSVELILIRVIKWLLISLFAQVPNWAAGLT